MAAQNKFAGKEHSGLFAHGQGPVMGQHVVNESENSGVFGGEGGGKHLSPVSGKAPNVAPAGSDGLFSLKGKSYAGPQNWQPDNMGDVSNQPSGK